MFKKIIVGILILVAGILLWSPWMSQNESNDAIFRVAALTKDNERCTERPWSATWAPFGRWVHHCDKKWYIGFWE